MSHVKGALVLGGLVGASYLQWQKGVACVRGVYTDGEHGKPIVELDNNRRFLAEPELVPSLVAAQQTQQPVNYWINQATGVNGIPCGGLGKPPKLMSLLRRS
jgi:hypothetical protein